MPLKKGDLILFIGDSITDCGRDRENAADLGQGYPKLAAAALSVLRPDLSLRFLNRGVSGDRTIDVSQRLESDCIALRPSMVSVLLGINDVWHRLNGRGLTDAEMENHYRKILAGIRTSLGEIPLLVLEPFLLPDKTVDVPREAVDSILPIIKRVAEEFGAVFVPLDAPLAKAAEAFPPLTLTREGIHPTAEGHAVIAKHWLDAALPLL